ncbi:DUF503 domain-containing protein [Ketobacter alkanivorans]|uniref:DUF503 domain-containing protein n=1 Tax=Ketobacter alkanivorans TaxID=1917421 RepID=A0A2K9LGT4_9GAMM|nr:DUF503 domain-containing protein [Ketobacter alkanivorans]AUM11559.1 hypothetical protein Kalk_03620 [Ketobacter alkanivorans]
MTDTACILYSELEIHIPYSQSLKDKRQVVNRFRDRIRNQFNASVAEVGSLEDWQRAGIAIVMVGNSRTHLDRQLSALQAHALEIVDGEIQWHSREWL